MRRVLMGLVLGLVATVANAAPNEVLLRVGAEMQEPTTVPIGASVRATWDAAPDEALHEVSRYEWRVDDGVWQDSGLAVRQAVYSGLIPQAFVTRGTRNLQVRACNEIGCGPTIATTFIVTLPLPNAPRNLRTEPGPVAALSVPQAIDRANAYALWHIDRELTPPELAWVAAQWPAGQRLDKLTLINHLDALLPGVAR